ncbi:hypothetical protein VPARA_11410 [Variovorax paradoxus]|uniref:Uncharacterized protein n=2 Tax=Variovorax paradoxus TaxID=34073 RepID=A0A0H2M5K1_VARPD|nr:hypothetical protein VPARA_11410 [Variovorax paradoxus]
MCEGLEYALLGSVEEADSKRIEANTYLTNTHANAFVRPTLKATDHQGQEVDVVANADMFRFCFIEKNRIDAFSRIAARPAARRTELIATLFGMEKFNDFVGNFNESMDAQLTLSSGRQLILAARRTALTGDQALIDGQAAQWERLATEEAALAASHKEGLAYSELAGVIGSPEAPGRLQELTTILDAVPPNVVGLTREGLVGVLTKAADDYAELAKIDGQLDALVRQVSFKELFTAVLQLQEGGADHCPACDTPLHVAASNPFDKASAGLKDLEGLGKLQDERKSAIDGLAASSRDLRGQLSILSGSLVGESEPANVIAFLDALPPEPRGAWWAHLSGDSATPEGQATLEQLLLAVDAIEARDVASRQAREEREANIVERNELIALSASMQAQDAKRQKLVDDLMAAAGRIAAFDVTNADLIVEVAQEALDVERDSPIKAAYDRFLTLLKSYKNLLPGTLMAGINGTAMELYNEFNAGDLDDDKLSALSLPETGTGKVFISFRGKPEIRVDALHVLSEGHVRCLGLAILLAKAIAIQTPLVVFDDAINAIDHDHRRGIRETIFENDRFGQMQLLVTCHSNEFIKDIQQQLPAADCKVYLFRRHSGDYQPRIRGDLPSLNYVAKAREARDSLQNRDALAASRQALEMLSEKIWKWLASHEHGEISIQLSRVGGEPGLRNLCAAILKKLRSLATFDHPNKPILINALERILGIPAPNSVWVALNKGTHEEADRDDFDGNLVEDVVVALEEMARLDLRDGR